MAFFQNSVLKRHLNALDNEKVKTAYEKFSEYFHNPDIQENIQNAKEEQFQQKFLIELFVNVLGYTINPDKDYNLTTEFKNEVGSKKADGAILENGKAIAVIELKGTDTTDLDKINDQAFSYKNNQTNCVYVITSNFEKLRFFIHNSVEHLEFNLFELTEKEFQLLWLCLSADSLFKSIPLKVKEQSLLKEEDITKQLYKDYSAFKKELWQNMLKNMPDADQLILFKRAQKLLDRFLFIFFAEDSGLLPPNSISRIVKNWETLEELDAYKPLYEVFKQYFGYINTGRKGKKTIDDIFAYNGGLFFDDEILDNVVIDDEVLHPHVMKLTNYDFQSEVDVNILGHIFENSLTEIENITAELEGQKIDKSKTKRKKDGVYYTPKYITKYIVENTVGRLCEEKKEELGIVDEEYAKGRKHRKKETIKELDEKLTTYRDWLLNITICDPACGSGAFLNQALEFLIGEHSYISELRAELFGESFVLPDVSNDILERNIYGVDINDESVEIAKLSLWLRTAQKGRKLTSLNNNIKCGNSLIDDPEVAGDKAFNWEKEFPEVFANGGFDVVIGNPPWGAKFSKKDTKFIKQSNKEIIVRMTDSFMFFVNKTIEIVNNIGCFGLIVPDVILYQVDNEKLRKKLILETQIIHALNLGDGIFEDVARPSSIIVCKKEKDETELTSVGNFQKTSNIDIFSISNELVKQNLFNSLPNTLFPTNEIDGYKLLNKISSDKLSSFIDDDGIQRGVSPDLKEAFVVNIDTVAANNLERNLIHKTVTGGVDVKRFHIPITNKNIIYVGKNDDPEKIPNIIDFLSTYRSKITCSEVKQGKHPFYTLHRTRNEKIFNKPSKVIGVITGDKIITAVDNNYLYPTDGLFVFNCNDSKISNKAISSILNSKLTTYFYRLISSENNRTLAQVKPVLLAKLPFIQPSTEISNKLEGLYNEINNKFSELFLIENNFSSLVQTKLEIDKLTKKLQNWHKLEFKDFLKELEKKKVKLSLSEEAEWMNYFNEQKAKALEIKAEIDKTDKEIDQMVYELYELTPEEIKIVEEAD